MKKVKVIIVVEGEKTKVFEGGLAMVSVSNFGDNGTIGTRNLVIGNAHPEPLSRAYVALGVAVHDSNARNVYGSHENARSVSRDLAPKDLKDERSFTNEI